MPVELRVARTAHDLKHLNRIRLHGFGVAELRLKISDALQSKAHLPDGFQATKPGTDDFHFAPGVEKPKINWKIDDAFGAVTKGRLELFRRGQAAAIWKLDLKPDQLTGGEHTLEWDGGSLTKTDEFPDGYVTARFSPYKLKLTLSSEQPSKGALIGWTYFHVVLHEIKIELGPKKVLSEDRDKKLYDSLGGTLKGVVYDDNGAPGAELKQGEPKEIRLISNVFSTGNADMFDNTDFTEYEKVWHDGPNIPVIATLKVRDSGGKAVDAPLAVGNVKILWDWEDVQETVKQHHAKAKTFIEKAIDYDKKATAPKGDNCHADRGGKRGPAAASVFPAQAGIKATAKVAEGTFPFKVEAGANRKFSSFSYAWGSGEFAGKTGILLQPSRMAGDAYKITAWHAWDIGPDFKTLVLDNAKLEPPLHKHLHEKLPAPLHVWRRIDVVSYRKKKDALPNFPIATFQGYYDKAYVRMILLAGIKTFPKDAYNTKFAAAVAGLGDDCTAAVDSTLDQWTFWNGACQFRDWAGFKTALTPHLPAGTTLAAYFAGAGSHLSTEALYIGWLENWATSILDTICGDYMAPGDGVNLFHVQGLHNYEGNVNSRGLNGYAGGGFPGVGRTKCAFVLCAGADNYKHGSNRMEQTVAHEIGHDIFLAHSPDDPNGIMTNDAANKPDPPGHDVDWHNCLMSYNYSQERKFCGFCLLRLRGWNRLKLTNTAAGNRK
jgi:hypothetical protein